MFHSQQLLFINGKPISITIRNYERKDFEQIRALNLECFPPPFPPDLLWNPEQLENHVSLFPEGAICIEIDGKIASSMTSLRTNFDPTHPDHTWEEVTDQGYIKNHDPHGNTLYIVDISVSPAYRSLGLGKIMMQSMYQIVVHLGLERLVGGGRMPGYHKYANQLTAEEYVKAVTRGELRDPVISFLLNCGRLPIAVVENYLDDEESHNYGVLMEWKNPFLR